jgi:hypothetical protein
MIIVTKEENQTGLSWDIYLWTCFQISSVRISTETPAIQSFLLFPQLLQVNSIKFLDCANTAKIILKCTTHRGFRRCSMVVMTAALVTTY